MALPLCTTPQHPPARGEAGLPRYLQVLAEAQLRNPPSTS